MWASFNRFEIQLTKKQAASTSHSGDCEPEVLELLQLPAVKRQLKKINSEDLAAELKEYGAWNEEELADRAENEKRIIWIAACNITEECSA